MYLKFAFLERIFCPLCDVFCLPNKNKIVRIADSDDINDVLFNESFYQKIKIPSLEPEVAFRHTKKNTFPKLKCGFRPYADQGPTRSMNRGFTFS